MLLSKPPFTSFICSCSAALLRFPSVVYLPGPSSNPQAAVSDVSRQPILHLPHAVVGRAGGRSVRFPKDDEAGARTSTNPQRLMKEQLSSNTYKRQRPLRPAYQTILIPISIVSTSSLSICALHSPQYLSQPSCDSLTPHPTRFRM